MTLFEASDKAIVRVAIVIHRVNEKEKKKSQRNSERSMLLKQRTMPPLRF